MIMSPRCLRVRPLPARRGSCQYMARTHKPFCLPRLAKSGVRMRSTMRLMLVILEAIVEQRVIQKASPYVKPSSKRCSTPNTVTATILMTSVE